MKHLKILNYWTLHILLFTTLSFNLNAQFEIFNDSGDGGQLNISKFGTSFIELRPPGNSIQELGSTISMYRNNVFTNKSQTIRLNAATNGFYGSLFLETVVDLQPFGDANTTGIPGSSHPYAMIRLSKKSVTSGPAYVWNFGVYDQLEFSGDADGSSSDDCINCLTLAYETGGFAANYKYIFGSDGNFEIASDARLKENITEVSQSLDKILKLSSKRYHYIWSEKNPNKKSTGFLAQDVQKLFPELVSSIRQPNGKKSMTLNYIGMIPHITKGMQEQQEIITAQETAINNLQSQINLLSAQLKELKEIMEN